MKLSIVIPVYNEEAVIVELFAKLTGVLEANNAAFDDYEVIMVNDGSRDNSLELMRRARAGNPRIKVLNLSRNFGHQLAITAGMDHAQGDCVAVLDADLQDPPELLPAMVARIREGYDVVYGRRISRAGEGAFKKISAALYYRMLKKLTRIDIPADTGDFRVVSRRVLNDMGKIREVNRFMRGLICWVGYRQTAIDYERDQRHGGQTKYPLRAMLRLAWDGITSFSTVPLKLATMLGFFSIIIALLYSLVVLYAWWVNRVVSGWSSTMIMILFFGGMQLLILGVIGEYIGRISDEVKRRPLYLVESFE